MPPRVCDGAATVVAAMEPFLLLALIRDLCERKTGEADAEQYKCVARVDLVHDGESGHADAHGECHRFENELDESTCLLKRRIAFGGLFSGGMGLQELVDGNAE